MHSGRPFLKHLKLGAHFSPRPLGQHLLHSTHYRTPGRGSRVSEMDRRGTGQLPHSTVCATAHTCTTGIQATEEEEPTCGFTQEGGLS